MVCVMLMVVGMTEFFNVRRGSLRPGVRLLQTNLSVLGHEQQLRAASKMRRQIKTGVAHGTIGMGIGGSMPVPPPPPPTWTRGGHSWIYDEQYGNGVRPNDSVWCDCDSLAECKEKCGKAEEPEPEPEPETVPGQERDEEKSMVEHESEEEVTGDENESAVPEEQPNEEPTQEEDEPVAQQEEPVSKQDEPEKPSGGTGYILTAPYEGYAPKLPPSGRGLPYTGVGPFQDAPGPDGAAPAGAPFMVGGGALTADGLGGGLLPSSWGGEDAAEHALTLSQWRVNILKSKLQQARLRKSLMAVSSPEIMPLKLSVEGGEEGEEGTEGQDQHVSSEGDEQTATVKEESHDLAAAVEKTDAQAQELTGLKDDLVSVASQTVKAISQLRQSVAALTTQRRQPVRAGLSDEPRSRGSRGRDREQGDEASGERKPVGLSGERRQDKWARLKEVQEATHTMLQRLDGVVAKIAAAKTAQRAGALRRYSVESKKQLGALANEVSMVAQKLSMRRRLQRRHASETASVRRELASLSRTAARRVARTESSHFSALSAQGHSAQEVWKGMGGFNAAAKAASILKVKQRADKQLNTLLAQVNEEIQRKAWRAKQAV